MMVYCFTLHYCVRYDVHFVLIVSIVERQAEEEMTLYHGI
jgi:hypothetical protein